MLSFQYMQATMAGRVYKLQILNSIIRFIAIDMVHMLGSAKRPSQISLHHQPMFQPILAFCNPDHYITIEYSPTSSPFEVVTAKHTTRFPGGRTIGRFVSFSSPVCTSTRAILRTMTQLHLAAQQAFVLMKNRHYKEYVLISANSQITHRRLM